MEWFLTIISVVVLIIAAIGLYNGAYTKGYIQGKKDMYKYLEDNK